MTTTNQGYFDPFLKKIEHFTAKTSTQKNLRPLEKITWLPSDLPLHNTAHASRAFRAHTEKRQ